MDKNITSMDIRDPGLRALPPGVERYLVKGGGLSVINLDPDENITINVNEDDIDFKISSKINETEELLIGKTIEFKYLEGLLKDEEINMKLIVIN